MGLSCFYRIGTQNNTSKFVHSHLGSAMSCLRSVVSSSAHCTDTRLVDGALFASSSTVTYRERCIVAALFSLSYVCQAGNKDEGLMFLLTDSQITNERFLIYINDLLASGNIPDLFAVDEVDSIVSTFRGTAPACGCPVC